MGGRRGRERARLWARVSLLLFGEAEGGDAIRDEREDDIYGTEGDPGTESDATDDPADADRREGGPVFHVPHERCRSTGWSSWRTGARHARTAPERDREAPPEER